MSNDTDKNIQYNSSIVQKIFNNKKVFHKEQSRMPIEKKIKALVELQKIVLKTRRFIDPKDSRRVWEV